MEKKKIAIISSNYPYGNSETFLHNEIIFLSKYFEIKVFPSIKKKKGDLPRKLPSNVTYDPPRLPNNQFIRMINGIFNFSPFLPYCRDLLSLIKKSKNFRVSIKNWYLNLITFRIFYRSNSIQEIYNDFDFIYFYWCQFPFKFIHRGDKNIFVRVHGGEIDLDRRKGYIPLCEERFINHDNVVYLPISEESKRKIDQFKSVNTYLNRLGVYDNGLGPSPVGDKIRIVSCSNLIPLKRPDRIIKALDTMHHLNVEWIHFGDGPLLSELEKLARKVPENVEVKFYGRVKNESILTYYKNNYIDLFMNVSESEGVPVSIMEAFSFGIPCFATDAGGTKELVNKTNGLLVDINFDINELTQFIRNIRKESVSNNLRENARKTWEQKCNANVNYRLLKNLFLQYDI